MKYQVKLTEYSIVQLEETAHYISTTLLAPDTATSWMTRLKTELSSLCEFPARYSLTKEES